MTGIARTVVPLVVLVVAGCAATLTQPPSAGPGSNALPTASPLASPSPTLRAYTWPGRLAAGTYTTSFVWDMPIVVTFTVPDGWMSRDTEIIKDPVSRVGEVGGPRGRSVVVALVDNVYADPCRGVEHDPPVGPSVEDLADALAGLAGVDSTVPVPVTLADYTGAYVELSIGPDAGCDVANVHLWTTRPEWMKSGSPSGGTVFRAEREHYRIWVLDVAGSRLLLAAVSAADSTVEDLAELQAVLDSIELRS